MRHDWICRELEVDCIPDATRFKKHLLTSLQSRRTAVIPAADKLAKCIDFHTIFSLVCGERDEGDTSSNSPYDAAALISYGRDEFCSFITYVSKLPHIVNDKLSLNPIMSHKIHDKIKDCLSSMV